MKANPELQHAAVAELVKWWEKKRVIFNLVLLFHFAALFYVLDVFVHFSWLIIFFVMGNLLYTSGWALEVLLLSFFENYHSQFGRFREWIFGFGLLLTAVAHAYVAWLSYWWRMEQ